MLFNNLASFKEYDSVLADVYGFMGVSYNVQFLFDSLEALSNILRNISTDPIAEELIGVFDRECFSKLQLILEVILVEMKNELEFTAAQRTMIDVMFLHVTLTRPVVSRALQGRAPQDLLAEQAAARLTPHARASAQCRRGLQEKSRRTY